MREIFVRPVIGPDREELNLHHNETMKLSFVPLDEIGTQAQRPNSRGTILQRSSFKAVKVRSRMNR
jgi:hypothetical protein